MFLRKKIKLELAVANIQKSDSTWKTKLYVPWLVVADFARLVVTLPYI